MILSSSSSERRDPLSDALLAFGSGPAQATRLEAAGEWSLRFGSRDRLKFVGLVKGRCCLVVAGQDILWIEAGDVVLIGRTDYVVTSDPRLTPAEGSVLYAGGTEGAVRLGGDDVVLIGASVGLDAAGAAFVLDALPAWHRIGGAVNEAGAISSLLEFADREAHTARPGARLAAMRLAELLLIEGVRAFISASGPLCAGWISALGDRQVGEALRLMHASPARQWTVPLLAKHVGLSRSAFSARFSRLVGRPPLEYLRGWRMVLSQRLLTETTASVEQVALSVGYSSQGAFGFAYKRAFGYSPRHQN